MKRAMLLVPIMVLIFSLLVVPRIARAKDSQSDTADASQPEPSEAEKQAEQQAAEAAKHQAEQLAEQRKQAQQQRQEGTKKAAEAASEALKQQSEQNQERGKKAAEARKEAFQRSCEERRENFKTRLDTVADALHHRVNTLSTIVGRVKTFVQDKHLAVANYAQLLVAVGTQKELAQKVYEASKQEANGLDCSSADAAKGSLGSFKDAVRQELQSISAYKTAVTNLIAAAKSAAQTSEGASNANAQ